MTMQLPDFTKVRALVVGDVMLDQYVHGRVSRISPEAPVSVFNACNTTYAAGGAANVAMNLAALGCHVELVGAIGKDAEGKTLVKELGKSGIAHHFGFTVADRTTCKTRFVVADKHLLRMDQDGRAQWREHDVERLVRWITRQMKRTDVVVLSDYGKGILTEVICKEIISLAKKANVPVMVDPKGRDYYKYRGASLIKPNYKEFVEATGCTMNFQDANWQEELFQTAVKFGDKLRVGAMLVTLGEKGMMYAPIDKKAKRLYLAAEAKEVFDVSGAGDTSMAVVSAALALKIPVHEAVGLANAASGIAVAKTGTSVVSFTELEVESSIKSHNKILSLDECARVTAALKRQGKIIGFTNGCFDCCHLGHIQSIQNAKSLCDVLVVGVNSDEWIAKNKGRGRPIQDEATRTGLLAALEYVDFVVVFSTPTALPLVKKIRPQIIAKEGYALADWPEGRFVQSIGGKAVELQRVGNYSTTSLVKRMEMAK